MSLIGGPVLRRVELSHAFVWIALDKAASINAEARLNPNGAAIARCSNQSKSPVQLGDNLFVYLLKMVPVNGEFPTEKKIYYDIEINGEGLAELGLTSSRRPIVYASEILPSFFVPKKHRNILQGSCRKPHAGSRRQAQYDQMQRGDGLVGQSVSDLGLRPSLLFLTGDQIYADDVAAPLLAAIIEKAEYLTGWQELLPPKKDRPIQPGKIKLMARGGVLSKRQTGFTSGNKENHLMTFGEYMAMYLAVWGGLQIQLPDWNEVKSRVATRMKRKPPRQRMVKVPKISPREYTQQAARVRAFLDKAWRARRLMANTPTYMIFDDHEVTDDWNLTEEIAEHFNKTPLSKRIVSNALTAYWACQGWGNEPGIFKPDFRSTVSEFLMSKRFSGGASFDNLLRSIYWGFTIEGYPATIVLDTRTQRIYSGGRMSQLVKPEVLEEVSKELDRLERKYRSDRISQSMILVSAAPVYGFTALELVQLKFAKLLAEKVDAESWIGNKTAFENLQNVFSRLFTSNCCIFSGDVHYAFNRMERLQSNAFGNTTNIFQLTASAINNRPEGAFPKGLKSLQSLSKLKNFNRLHSHYLWPKNEKKYFICGNTNIGLLQLKDGQPETYILYSYDPDERRSYKWVYDLKNPEIVHFDRRMGSDHLGDNS
ncbi:MAG: hypothetical protein ACC641_11280 [Acidiferrobacterales bacterium]